jgi:IS30 family transposase
VVPSKEVIVVRTPILEATKPYRGKVLSYAYDNGKEFAMHELLTEIMEAQTYFANSYHSWERGLNENTNGLILQYFSRKSDFSPVTKKEVKEVQDKLNLRPRKCLHFKTPNDIFFPTDSITLVA